MKYLIVTSINSPTAAVVELAKGAKENDWKFVVIGDRKSPVGYDLDSVDFYSVAEQTALPFNFARLCPTGHYARKNIGYLLAMADGASEIIETDDDNFPLESFWDEKEQTQTVRVFERPAWINVYAYFSKLTIWPRGYPLNLVRESQVAFEDIPSRQLVCPVQQGLADLNPDVDAIYRLLFPLPVTFDKGIKLALAGQASCPFNSQNTRWWPQAYPLLYLPFYCSFRMTDIWRSFVAQRILFANGAGLLFHESTVLQERNEHDLMRDFADEVEGYCNNSRIMEALMDIELGGTAESMLADMVLCYERLVSIGVVAAEEMQLLAAWKQDCERIAETARQQ